MSQIVEVAAAEHRHFGALVTIRMGEQPVRRLTPNEAGILSRALKAVADGASLEKQIFMSPIASDHEFEALAHPEGVAVKAPGCPDVFLDWIETRALAEALAKLAG
ncbi:MULTISPECIES: hypothetical protein [Methylosinus]|uniref:Uncharacterized protein n=1 Tax=Methylosinus sporium TaxID=428 RepID=A0A2U1SVU5_METSR|nr:MULTISPECIES: hypothetical protein [Methylosinus]MBU3889320.1 hypothetical protein [Methylosinus sp. KRF6]PWB95726.1 hypothetical protein C5689_01020 [Methylosinus sporium]TRL34471.1 hypothetical protein FM996_09445 [Methylosinus sporium]